MDMSALDKLSEDVKAKVLAAKTPEEVLSIAKAEGYKLSDDELAAINGGNWDGPDCGFC